MKNIINRILFKLYIQDVLGFFNRRLKTSRYKIIGELLNELLNTNGSKDEKFELVSQYLGSKDNEFYNICFGLVEQILLKPNVNTLSFNFEHVKHQDISLIIQIADSFGRFDLGYLLRAQYCIVLEKNVLRYNSKRGDRVLYLIYKQLFGDELFAYHGNEIKVKAPFYLRQIYNRFYIRTSQKKFLFWKKIDLDFHSRINNKTIALLAPGLLQFDEIVSDLREFDEIIPLTYTKKHFKDLPFKINISYYNGDNSLRLINDDSFREGIDLEIYCFKEKIKTHPKYREMLRDTHMWSLGHPNMIQATLHDLLCHNPKKVKIFGMNFFLSDQPYHRFYQSNLTLNALSSHNILSNFFYIKKLYSDGLIELDQKATEIVVNGAKHYSEEMVKLYASNLTGQCQEAKDVFDS